MKRKYTNPLIIIIVTLFVASCSFSPPEPTATPAPTDTPTATATSTITPTPTKTPVPTKTPNLAATKQYEEWNAEIQKYYEAGYVGTTEGKIKEFDDFSEEWAQLNWYDTWGLGESASEFVYSAHYKWEHGSKTPNESGCGLVFGYKENGNHYAVFLDKTKVIFLQTEGTYGFSVGKTRGTGRVDLETTEADFTLIVYDYYTYVLVNGEVVGEYGLSKKDLMEGYMGISILSGTNKDFGTRCEITNIHLWEPKK